MIIKKMKKTAFPSEVINEARIKKAKKENVTEILDAIKHKITSGNYILMIKHDEKFNNKYGYLEVITNVMLTNEVDVEGGEDSEDN